MGGVAKFLLGGAIGAVLGFLISRKQSPTMKKGVRPLSSASDTRVATPWAPSVAPVAVVVPEESVEPEVEAVPEPEPVVPEPEAVVPEPEPGAFAEPEPVVPKPEVELPAAETSEFEAVMAEVASDSEVIVTPELLEEPLPGAGWEPSAALAGEEQAFEEILPLVPEDAPAHAAPDAVLLDVGDFTWPGVGSTEAEFEPVPTDAGLPDSEPDLGRDLGPDTVATPEVVPSAIPVAADDLRARIEATRRRIRRELEEPFMATGSGVAAEEIVRAPIPEPVIGEALMEQPFMDEKQAPSAEDSPAPLADGLPSPAVAEAEGTHDEPVSGLGAEYDAMRRRIETTRNRLKAKAFDAMMTGESALLGRDSAGAGAEVPALANIDSEIVQTIETTLREEEN